MPDVVYTSNPIQRFSISKYQFEKARLVLSEEEAEKFDEILARQPARIRAKVRKIDAAKADQIAKSFLTGGATKTIDSSLRLDPSQAGNPVVGTTDIVKESEARRLEAEQQAAAEAAAADDADTKSESGAGKPVGFGKFGK